MNLKKKLGSWVFLASLFVSLAAQAQDKTRVQVNVNPTDVGVGDIFIVNIQVSSEDLVPVDTITAPAIQGAQLRGQSRSQRSGGGATLGAGGTLEYQRYVSQDFIFQYVATQAGTLAVPSVDVNAGGKSYKSPVAQIRVSGQNRGGTAGRQRPTRPNMFDEEDRELFGDPFENIQKMEERFNKLLQRQFGGSVGGFQAVPNINENDAFVIVAEVDKTEVFEGEQITASWYLYTKAGVREIDTLKYPDLKGFWKEDIELATLLNFQNAELNGQAYNRALLASFALFPIEDGKAVIDPYKAKVTVAVGFGRGVTNTKSSQPIPILVKPLPEVGKPASFSGAVGEYQIQAAVESASVVAHQPFVVKVHVEGRGNAKQFELPNPTLPPHVEIYDIKKDSKFFNTGIGFKDFEIYLIPRQEGELIIPPITTSVFNPRTQKYETLATPEFKVNVMPGSGQQGMQSSRLQKQGGEEVEEKLNLLTEWQPAHKDPRPNMVLWLALFVATGLGLTGLAAYRLRWFRKPLGTKERFEARLPQLKKWAAQQKWRELGIEATNLSSLVLGEISGTGGGNLQIDKLLEKAPPSVRRNIGDELKKIMDKFYLLGFGPDEVVAQAARKNTSTDDIKTLEKLLRQAIELSGTEKV